MVKVIFEELDDTPAYATAESGKPKASGATDALKSGCRDPFGAMETGGYRAGTRPSPG